MGYDTLNNIIFASSIERRMVSQTWIFSLVYIK